MNFPGFCELIAVCWSWIPVSMVLFCSIIFILCVYGTIYVSLSIPFPVSKFVLGLIRLILFCFVLAGVSPGIPVSIVWVSCPFGFPVSRDSCCSIQFSMFVIMRCNREYTMIHLKFHFLKQKKRLVIQHTILGNHFSLRLSCRFFLGRRGHFFAVADGRHRKPNLIFQGLEVSGPKWLNLWYPIPAKNDPTRMTQEFGKLMGRSNIGLNMSFLWLEICLATS